MQEETTENEPLEETFTVQKQTTKKWRRRRKIWRTPCKNRSESHMRRQNKEWSVGLGKRMWQRTRCSGEKNAVYERRLFALVYDGVGDDQWSTGSSSQ